MLAGETVALLPTAWFTRLGALRQMPIFLTELQFMTVVMIESFMWVIIYISLTRG